MVDKVEHDELSVDEVWDGLIDTDVGLDDAMAAEVAAEEAERGRRRGRRGR